MAKIEDCFDEEMMLQLCSTPVDLDKISEEEKQVVVKWTEDIAKALEDFPEKLSAKKFNEHLFRLIGMTKTDTRLELNGAIAVMLSSFREAGNLIAPAQYVAWYLDIVESDVMVIMTNFFNVISEEYMVVIAANAESMKFAINNIRIFNQMLLQSMEDGIIDAQEIDEVAEELLGDGGDDGDDEMEGDDEDENDEEQQFVTEVSLLFKRIAETEELEKCLSVENVALPTRKTVLH